MSGIAPYAIIVLFVGGGALLLSSVLRYFTGNQAPKDSAIGKADAIAASVVISEGPVNPQDDGRARQFSRLMLLESLLNEFGVSADEQRTIIAPLLEKTVFTRKG